MSSGSKFGFGLNLRKKAADSEATASQKPRSTTVASAFGEESDEDKDESASQRFDRKYANTKIKDQRLVDKLAVEDPSIFDYDKHYEEIQRQRDQKVADQKEADKEKKPKYAHLIVHAHKKRELEKLVRDENTYKKERVKEAGQFDDKEVYVTGAYKKQIEERTKMKEELDREAQEEALRDVKGQQMWQQAFNRTMLDNISREYVEPAVEKEEDLKPEVKEETAAKQEMADQHQEEEIDRRGEEIEQKLRRRLEEREEEKRREQRRRRSRSRSPSGSRRRPAGSERSPERRRKNRSRSPRERRDRSSERHKRRRVEEEETAAPQNARKGDPERGTVPAEEDEVAELRRRMARICEILARRNDAEAIEEARQRYRERRARGEIVAPK